MNAQVTVLYFAKSAELAGVRSERLTVPHQLISRQLWELILRARPGLSVLQGRVVLAVRQQYVAIDSEQPIVLQDDDEVAVVPPLSGEMEGVEVKKDEVKLTVERLCVEKICQFVSSVSCGATAVFLGTTRDNFEGRKVIGLQYEAYEAMAQSQLTSICRDIRARWPVIFHICIHHRLGWVAVGEASVAIAISSPHRADALEAVEYCINTLKATVPIWKKELYEGEESRWKENAECDWNSANKAPS